MFSTSSKVFSVLEKNHFFSGNDRFALPIEIGNGGMRSIDKQHEMNSRKTDIHKKGSNSKIVTTTRDLRAIKRSITKNKVLSMNETTKTIPEINNEGVEASLGGCPTPPRGGDEGAIAGGSLHGIEIDRGTTVVAPPSTIETTGSNSKEPLNQSDEKK